jgi:hypothetical protein
LTIKCSYIINPEPSCFIFTVGQFSVFWVSTGVQYSVHLFALKNDASSQVLHLIITFKNAASRTIYWTQSFTTSFLHLWLQYHKILNYYHCLECFKWCSNISTHFGCYHSTSLRSHKLVECYFCQLSNALDFSKPSLCIQLLVTPTNIPESKVSGPMDAISLEYHIADSDMPTTQKGVEKVDVIVL